MIVFSEKTKQPKASEKTKQPKEGFNIFLTGSSGALVTQVGSVHQVNCVLHGEIAIVIKL